MLTQSSGETGNSLNGCFELEWLFDTKEASPHAIFWKDHLRVVIPQPWKCTRVLPQHIAGLCPLPFLVNEGAVFIDMILRPRPRKKIIANLLGSAIGRYINLSGICKWTLLQFLGFLLRYFMCPITLFTTSYSLFIRLESSSFLSLLYFCLFINHAMFK